MTILKLYTMKYLSRKPRNWIDTPVNKENLKPLFSITHIDMKFIGKNMIIKMKLK